MTRGSRLPLIFTLAAALSAPGCDYLHDRLRECQPLRIDLVNDVRNGPPLNLVMESEAYGPGNVVAPGASRQVSICAERGDAKRFRVARDERTLDIANCVVTRPTGAYEFTVSRVVWEGLRLRCENW